MTRMFLALERVAAAEMRWVWWAPQSSAYGEVAVQSSFDAGAWRTLLVVLLLLAAFASASALVA